ncbi:putative response regulatory protein [Flagellimonas maritima]|uniref:Putative response regulatory protein n=1 Tax=Flagellimonas maritima TaxID=1383885 RepID=A0A2Z4LR53_9FLAO|nr:LytTR family DNA-binding domain-containing protein [Allomuricauda aurantiaca]AWX44371.1 putative response regulatory protein [Allomuricauda aurantiaca]
MKCIIIDDEPLALGIIKSYCEELGGLEVLGTFTNPLESMDILQEKKIDLVFLDIEMPQINGIEFVKSLETKPIFIFTTAYPQYAIEGFELNAIDYMVKPIPFPRFVKSINRAKELYEMRRTMNDTPANVASAGSSPILEDEFIFVKSDYENLKIKLNDIRYIQGLKDYLKIHTFDSKPILTLMNFKDMEAKLPSGNFLRVHRSFIVNVHNVDSIQRSRIIIEDIRIPIGDSYKEDFMKRIGL